MRHAITIFAVDDVARAARFYEAAVGAKPRLDVGVYAELDLPDGPGVGVYQREGFAKNTGRPSTPCGAGSTTGTELYFRVDDVDAALARALAAGAVMLSPTTARPWGETVAYVADPDRNVLAFAMPSR
jgi:predicted enzyme related to lactoylglutathione lyase